MYENMLTITNLQRKASQKYNEMSFSDRITIIEKTKNNKCWLGCAERSPLAHC